MTPASEYRLTCLERLLAVGEGAWMATLSKLYRGDAGDQYKAVGLRLQAYDVELLSRIFVRRWRSWKSSAHQGFFRGNNPTLVPLSVQELSHLR